MAQIKTHRINQRANQKKVERKKIYQLRWGNDGQTFLWLINAATMKKKTQEK